MKTVFGSIAGMVQSAPDEEPPINRKVEVLGRQLGAISVALCLLVFAEPVSFMVRHHPYGNVFFNRLAGDGMRRVRDRFEMDYWGLSYRRGLEYVLRHDKRGSIKVTLQPGLGEASAAILPAAERLRLVVVEKRREAEYFLGNYRWHSGEYPFRHEVYSVRVGDASIMTVYDLRFDRWDQAYTLTPRAAFASRPIP